MIGAKRVIDMHVHLAGPGDGYPEDLWWSEAFERGIGFAALKILKGWSFRRVTDDLMIQTLKREALRAQTPDLAVILALDRVYDADGSSHGFEQADPALNLTTLYVSNRLVVDLCRPGTRLLPGISVHPFRDDALDELDRYRDQAALCKWLPSAQRIDFEDGRDIARVKLDRFYAKLAQIGMPLLFHAGVESSIPTTDSRFDRFNNPKYIERALDLGATVIVAHCGCSYFDLLQDNVVDETLRLFPEDEAPAQAVEPLRRHLGPLFAVPETEDPGHDLRPSGWAGGDPARPAGLRERFSESGPGPAGNAAPTVPPLPPGEAPRAERPDRGQVADLLFRPGHVRLDPDQF